MRIEGFYNIARFQDYSASAGFASIQQKFKDTLPPNTQIKNTYMFLNLVFEDIIRVKLL